MIRTTHWPAFVMAILVAISPVTIAASPTTAPAKKPLVSQFVHQQSARILDQIEADGDFAAGEKAAQDLFDQVTLYVPDEKLDAIRDASFCLRLVHQVGQMTEADQRVDTLKYLRKNPDLASALVFLVPPGKEKVDGVYTLLNQLREKHAAELDKYANLTAALCVTRDMPLKSRINENTAEADDAVKIWEFYVANESKMFFGLKNVPTELLVYVVDTTSSVADLQWALAKYAGDKDVGHRFFDIKYDYDNFRHGTEKQVTTQGYTLPNILKYGGVCADQAYFASEVAKAIGVPASYTTGAAAEAGHAWVGFLQTDGRTGAWNFNSGRYAAYQGVRGNCRDPLTRKKIPDSYIALLGELISTKTVDRQNCVALTDVAQRLKTALKDNKPIDAAMPDGCAASTLRPAARKADAATILGLVELSLHQSAGYAPAWFEVRDMATDNQLTLADKRRWADVLMKLGAKKYPDFTLEILTPMVQTVSDVKEQDSMWKALLPLFKTRFDLSASIMMNQAEMWEAAEQPDKAGGCYMDIVQNYANAGPFIIKALAGAEKLLVSTNRADKVVQLYAQTWKTIKPPQEMAQQFAKGSSWYRVGKLYADKLKAAGQDALASDVQSQIDSIGNPTAAAGK